MAAVILAWDLVKYKEVACVFDPASGETRFETVPTTAGWQWRIFRNRRNPLSKQSLG